MVSVEAILCGIDKKLDTIYQTFHRVMFGCGGKYAPPRWLWILWCAITIVRFVPATYSLWEDPLWGLVTKINQPWLSTLGFNAIDMDHILYYSISKVIIKATHHHWIEFTYRIPSLVAGFLVMPLGFAVFSRIGGPLCGTMFGLCAVLLPTFTLYADDARGYMLLVFSIIWALGLTPGLSERLHPVRLGIAYFLIGVSHGLGLILTGCFALCGCFTGSDKHARSIVFVNMLLTLPAFLYNIPMINKMLCFGHAMVNPEKHAMLQGFAFFPKWVQFQFGTPFFPYISFVFLLLMACGVIVVTRQSWKTGVSLIIFSSVLPVLFGITHVSYTLERYSMCCMPFWLWALCMGGTAIARHVRGVARYAPLAFGALLVTLMPALADYVRYPQQDYRETYKTILRNYPDQKTVFGFTSCYSVGLEFYARQYGLTYVALDSLEQLSGASWIQSPRHCIIVPSESDTRPAMLQWLKKNAVLIKKFKGTALDTWLYVAKDAAK
ncbi:MAG: hypothetical protein PHC61_01215 [Chitinivibrionales bacterium]|nr:hypothetical protein [Chitinivibrionales bacterium]